MPSGLGTPTLDQLHVLIQVVETGSFTAAARKMNRALSVVSYTIGNLEAQLGVELFDRNVSRKPQLTEAGRVVLAEARSVVGGIGNLRAKVAGMAQGIEGELHVALDSLLSSARVVDALTAFSDQFPTVKLNLHIETLGAVANLVLGKIAVIGFSGQRTRDFDELHRIGIGSLRMVPVAGARHPLACVGGNRPGAAREHVQLVVYDRSPLTKDKDYSVVASRTWRLADLCAKHMLLRAGIGWGVMPLAMVEDDLAKGALVQLDVPELAPFDYPLDAIYRADTPPAVVTQQFEVAEQVAQHNLLPIIEPEVLIGSSKKAAAEAILKSELVRRLNARPDGCHVMLKLTIPDIPDFYADLIGHGRVRRVVALSGGYTRADACRRLSANPGVIASFSRALIGDLRCTMDDTAFNGALTAAVDEIYDASSSLTFHTRESS